MWGIECLVPIRKDRSRVQVGEMKILPSVNGYARQGTIRIEHI